MEKKKIKRSLQDIMNTPMPEIDPYAVERGRAYVKRLIKIEGLDSVETVSSTWENRPKSNIVKWLMEQSGRTLDEIARSLGCKTSYLNNKLHRDSFSVDDMVIIAYVCGYAMTFTANNPDDTTRSTFQIDVEKYFQSYDEEVLNRLRVCEQRLRMQKKDEYEELKAKLAQMKEEYGFED